MARTPETEILLAMRIIEVLRSATGFVLRSLSRRVGELGIRIESSGGSAKTQTAPDGWRVTHVVVYPDRNRLPGSFVARPCCLLINGEAPTEEEYAIGSVARVMMTPDGSWTVDGCSDGVSVQRVSSDAELLEVLAREVSS